MNPILLTANLLTLATPTASGTAAGFDVRNLVDGRPYTWWQAPAVGTYTIDLNCGSVQSADTIAIYGHNLATLGATLSVKSKVGADWVTRMNAFTPSSDDALLRCFPLVAAQEWRLTITAPAGVPRLAIAFLGKRLTMPQPPDSPYIPCEQDVEEETPLSEGGYPLGTAIKFKPIRTRPAFSNLDRGFVFDDLRALWESHFSARKVFFYAWDIDTYPHDFVYLAQHVGKYDPAVSILSIADRFDLDLRCWR